MGHKMPQLCILQPTSHRKLMYIYAYVILSVCVHNEETNTISFGVSFFYLKYL